MATEPLVLDLKQPNWEKFDPKGHQAGPNDYPDDLLGTVEWLREYTEGPLETESGTVGLSICHMEGDATSFSGRRIGAETRIMTLFEGSGEVALDDGSIRSVSAPCVVYVPRGTPWNWRYTTRYRGLYVLLW